MSGLVVGRAKVEANWSARSFAARHPGFAAEQAVADYLVS